MRTIRARLRTHSAGEERIRGLILVWEEKGGVTGRGDSCSIHIFRAELLYLKCILRLIQIKNGNKPYLYQLWSDSSFLMGCSLPPAL